MNINLKKIKNMKLEIQSQGIFLELISSLVFPEQISRNRGTKLSQPVPSVHWTARVKKNFYEFLQLLTPVVIS